MELLQDFANYIYGHLVGHDYLGIFIMMTLESSFILFPSEVCMIPAGIEVANGNMSLFWAIFWGTFGSWFGSTINYVIARFYGREFIYKFGKYVRIDLEKMEKLEKYFHSHGKITVFVIRFIPVVRQYISFPAGMAKMNFLQFSIYTSLGAGLWVTVLALLGQSFGAEFGAVFADKQIHFDLMKTVIKPHINEILLYTGLVIVALIIVYKVFAAKFLQSQNEV